MAAMASMPEVTSEDSISRRGSAVSLPRSQGNNIHGNRPNSHTQHAAAIAAATTAANAGAASAAAAGGHMGGPRAPPTNLKESRSWSFTRFDDKTKRQLADSVSEASQTSDARPRLGGPRPLAASDIAVKTGVLPPPMCTEPKEVRQPPQQEYQQPPPQQQQQQQQHVYQPYSTDPEKAGPESGGGGGWKSDWWALRTVAGWVSPAGSGATTPVSTPGVGPGPGPLGGRSRAARLSTVAEDWVPAGGISGNGGSNNNNNNTTYYHDNPSPPVRPPLLRVTRDQGQHQDVHAVDRAGIPTPPPPSAAADSAGGSRPVRAPTAARVRLIRAQEALKSQARAKSGPRVILTRPVHLTGDRRGGVEEDRLAPARPPLQTNLSIPGSFVDD